MNRYFRSYLYSFAVLLPLLCSCMSDKYSNCPPDNIRIHFSYRVSVHGTPVIDTSAVDRINLFIFDQGGKFVGEWIDEHPLLNSSYYMEVPLEYGNYQMVCWAGLSPCYYLSPSPFVKGVTDLSECLLSLERIDGGIVENPPHPLFHAQLRDCVVDKPDCEFTLDLRQLTNTINLSVEGLPPTANDYSFRIADTNGDYSFDSSFASANNGELHYITPCTRDAQEQPSASLVVLDLNESSPTPVLTLKDVTTEKSLFSGNLITLLLKLRDQGVVVDLDAIHTYDIRLTFTGLNVTVSINGWEVSDSHNEI